MFTKIELSMIAAHALRFEHGLGNASIRIFCGIFKHESDETILYMRNIRDKVTRKRTPVLDPNGQLSPALHPVASARMPIVHIQNLGKFAALSQKDKFISLTLRNHIGQATQTDNHHNA